MAVVLKGVDQLRVHDLVFVVLGDVVVVMRAGSLLGTVLFVLLVKQVELVHFLLELRLDLLKVPQCIVLLVAGLGVGYEVAVVLHRLLDAAEVDVLVHHLHVGLVLILVVLVLH